MLPRTLTSTLVLAAIGIAQDSRLHGAEHARRGLPNDPAAFAPYHADSDHPANRLFRLTWLRRLQPAEVAAPAFGTAMEWTSGWVHRKRVGTATDTHWFGGDGRLLPLEFLDASETKELRALLTALRDSKFDSPTLQVLLQHDLLRIAERVHDVGRDGDLLPELLATVRALALPAHELDRLPDPLATATTAEPKLAAALPKALGGTDTQLREVLRKSTRLFDAGKSLLWSRVFLAHPNGEPALAALLPAARPDQKEGPEVPIGMRAVLVQGIVALDRDGKPRSTPLVFDVRTQRLANRDGLSADNATFTHDGIDFGIWQLQREGVRRGESGALFRRIEADDHDLFRDYGTAKHTTYRGQCALCHRVTDTPEPHLGGFPVLRPHALATFATTGAERFRLAEEQVQKLLDKFATPAPASR